MVGGWFLLNMFMFEALERLDLIFDNHILFQVVASLLQQLAGVVLWKKCQYQGPLKNLQIFGSQVMQSLPDIDKKQLKMDGSWRGDS